MVNEWIAEDYPSEYTQSFQLPDIEVVSNYAKNCPHPEGVEAVVLEKTDKGVVVHLQSGPVRSQVNWAEPLKTPGDYLNQGYANRFWQFCGPPTQQEVRARMLAVLLAVEVRPRPIRETVSFPSFGIEIEKPI